MRQRLAERTEKGLLEEFNRTRARTLGLVETLEMDDFMRDQTTKDVLCVLAGASGYLALYIFENVLYVVLCGGHLL